MLYYNIIYLYYNILYYTILYYTILYYYIPYNLRPSTNTLLSRCVFPEDTRTGLWHLGSRQ